MVPGPGPIRMILSTLMSGKPLHNFLLYFEMEDFLRQVFF